MSFFSESFRETVAASGVPVATLAQLSGVSSAMLYKIQSGSRMPDSLETLKRLLDLMHCSLPQKTALIQEYMICTIGFHRYSCIQEVKGMLANFVAPPLPALELHYDPDAPSRKVIVGESNVSAVIQQVLDQETRRPRGQVNLFLDMQYEYVVTSLGQALNNCHPEFGSVTHLFCLKDTASGDAILHNVRIFRAVLPRMASMKHYEPCYCYLPDPNDGTVPFPYYIITSACVLLLDSGLQTALYLTDSEMRRQYQLKFHRIREQFSPCMQGGGAGLDMYFRGFHQIIGRHTPDADHKPAIIAAKPCMLPCLAPEKAFSYLPEGALDPEMMEIAREYFLGSAVGGYESFYTLEGLRHLVETGEIMELQGDFVPRLRQEDALDALEEMVRRAKAGLYILHLFKTDLIPVSTRFSMTLHGSELMLYCESSVREAVYTTLAETTLATVVRDYVTYAEQLGDVYSPKESIALTEQVLWQYRKTI